MTYSFYHNINVDPAVGIYYSKENTNHSNVAIAIRCLIIQYPLIFTSFNVNWHKLVTS